MSTTEPLTLNPAYAYPDGSLASPPRLRLADPNGALIQINFPGTDRSMVRILQDGSMEFADDYTPDAAARAFWSAMVEVLPGYLRQPNT